MLALFAGLLVLVIRLLPPEPALSGRAVASDGDSIRIGATRVRLLGLDAPELDQVCGRDGEDWPCGREARALMTTLLKEQGECQPDGSDRYGRVLATCTFGGRDIGAAMVAAGLALSSDWAYEREEAEARASRLGIWSGTFEEPRVWRQQHAGETESFDLLEWLRRLL